MFSTFAKQLFVSMIFGRREIISLSLLMPLLCMVVWVMVEAFRKPSNSASPQGEIADSLLVVAANKPGLHLTTFDPNTVTFEQLRAMGIDKFVARNIVRYRQGGRHYSIPEDVAIVYGLSDSLYAALKPYIAIADEFKIKPSAHYSHSAASQADSARFAPRKRVFRKVMFDPNALDAEGFYDLGCFTARQAEALVEYRNRIGGFGSLLQFRDCYLIGESLYAEMSEYITLSPLPEPEKVLVDLNSADSLTLVSLRGIGPITAHDILLYRKRLGGYHSTRQLFDLAVVQPKNYELFEKEIWCDSCKIQKIDINFVAPKELASHPYMTPSRVRKIIKHRQLKGGWSNAEEFLADDILSADEAARIIPYLRFSTDNE